MTDTQKQVEMYAMEARPKFRSWQSCEQFLCRISFLTCHFYRPHTKLREGNVFTPVCMSFCSQGGTCVTCIAGGACMASGGMNGRRHVWQGVCMMGGACVGGGMHSMGTCTVGACMSEGMHAGGTATQVDGTHPTGMHSCDEILIKN